MAQFRGTVKGNRTQASRLGYKTSGLTTECNGWNSGVKVVARDEDDNDLFDIYATGGSGNGQRNIWIGTVFIDEKKELIFRAGQKEN